MPIRKVWIVEGCIVCRACEVVCAEVFKVKDDGAVVTTRKYAGYEAQIEQAAADCPVKVIEYSSGLERRKTTRKR